MALEIEKKRLIVEIIATLAHIKKTMCDMILLPAGVPATAYRPLINRRDQISGNPMSKRQLAPLLIDEIEKMDDASEIFKKIIEIAAAWKHYHLADDEFAARATVQKANDILGTIEQLEKRAGEERRETEKREREESARRENEFREKQLALLLQMFDSLADEKTDPHQRGYLLQELLAQLFVINGIAVHRSFTRNDGGEQIDGGFALGGWHYLVECRWRKKLADTRELDGLCGQVGRSGKQTMGVFLAINGWSSNVPELLKQNAEKSVILMDGYDLRCILDGQIDLQQFLTKKLARLNFEGEPFYGAVQYFADH